jgi:hypothetical protein
MFGVAFLTHYWNMPYVMSTMAHMMSAASGCPVGLSVDKASGSRWENRIYENSSTRKPMNRRGGGPTKATTLFNFFSDTHYNY